MPFSRTALRALTGAAMLIGAANATITHDELTHNGVVATGLATVDALNGVIVESVALPPGANL